MKQKQFRDDYLRQAKGWREMEREAPPDIKQHFAKKAGELEKEAKRAMTPGFKKLFCK